MVEASKKAAENAGLSTALRLPSSGAPGRFDLEDEAAPLTGNAPELFLDLTEDIRTVQTHTVLYNRNESPPYAVLYGKTASMKSPFLSVGLTGMVIERDEGIHRMS